MVEQKDKQRISKCGCPFCGSSAFELSGEKDSFNRPILQCSACNNTWPENQPVKAAKELNHARKELMCSVVDYNQLALPMGREVVYLALRQNIGLEIVRDFQT